jgi:hypothetical protein
MGNLVADPLRLWPKGVIAFDFDGILDAYQPPFDIQASVGADGANQTADVRHVQQLLNRFPPADGGPSPALGVDGFVGPKTVAAISQFQVVHFGWHDGRADPGGPTIIELTIDEFDPTPDQPKGVLLNAVHEWNKQFPGRMKWVKRTRRDANFVVFVSGTANRSKSVGMAGRKQVVEVNIDRARFLTATFGGTPRGVFIHEMGHAAGLGHEHQRADRDRFVQIDTANVARPCDFRTGPDPALNCSFPFTPCTPVGPYDYVSTMHYFTTQAARDQSRPTIHAIDSSGRRVRRPMGSFNGLSPGDVATLNRAYP